MCYIKFENVFIRSVALGIALLLTLISMPTAGYALDTIVRRCQSFDRSWLDYQPIYQSSCLYDDNLQNDLALHLMQATNYHLLAEMPIPMPAIGTAVATVSFPVEETADYRYWRDCSEEALRQIKESATQESIAVIIKKRQQELMHDKP